MRQNTGVNTHGLEICYQNCRGLNTKTHTFMKNLTSNCHSVIAITESWLTDSVSSGELFPPNYSVYRKDRNTGARGGGVLLAVDDCEYNSEIYELNCSIDKVDILAVKLFGSNHIPIIVMVVYIPPGISVNGYDELFELIEDKYDGGNMVIVGDFNIPELLSVYEGAAHTGYTARFDNFLNFCNLRQCNVVRNHNNRLLDLVVYREDTACEVLCNDDPLVPVDPHHPGLIVRVSSCPAIPSNFTSTAKRYDFKKLDVEKFCRLLGGTDWGQLLGDIGNVHDASDVFNNTVQDVIAKCVPKKKCSSRKYPLWFTKDLIHKIKVKKHYLKMYRKHRLIFYRERFRYFRKSVKLDIESAYRDFILRCQADLESSPSNFWKYINSKRNISRLPGHMCFNDKILKTPKDILNAFAVNFKSVYVCDNDTQNSNTPFVESFNLGPVLNIGLISEDMIITASKKLKNKFTIGPDDVPVNIVKSHIQLFVQPLRMLYNLMITSGTFPNIWKVSRICPILKSGKKSEIVNYRPIALISVFSKLIEIILSDIIFEHVRTSISEFQHGFVRSRSTVSNLSVFTQHVSKSLDSRNQIDVVYTDFSKAFDRVSHKRLLRKLFKFGLSNVLVSLLESFLTNREYYVEYEGLRSFSFTATSGVPQGSNLGPLLFILFINDILGIICSHKLLFADDLKLFKEVSCVLDCSLLQDDLNRLSRWCVENELPLNIEKCKTMTFTRKLTPITFHYKISNLNLTRVTEARDLGILFDQKLTFSSHIKNITSSAMKTLGFVIRNCKEFSSLKAISTIYQALVRSKLTYCSVVWNPCHKKYIDCIERVQKKFIKFLYFMKHGSYPDRNHSYESLLNEFEFASLRKVREINDLIFLYKIVHNQVDSMALLSSLQFNVPRFTSRSHTTFHIDVPNSYHHFFCPLTTMCRSYNNLRNVDIFFLSLSQFRRSLNHTLRN